MKKTVSLLLAAVLAAMLLSVPAMAATDYSDALGGFATSPKWTYYPDVFEDVDEGMWYGANKQAVIQRAFELRIMAGKGDRAFDPEGNITLAEAIKMASVVHHIFNGGDGGFEQGNPWYKVYVDYAIESEIIDKSSFDGEYERLALRSEMAGIFANCVPAEALPEINKVVYLPDVIDYEVAGEGGDLYSGEIFTLYRAGVLTGSDSSGSFRPYTYITRAEAAAIICRIVLPAERKTLNLSQVVVSAEYLTDKLLSEYKSFEEFVEFPGYQKILIKTNMTVKQFKFIEVEFSMDEDSYSFVVKSVPYSISELIPDKPFVVTWLEIGLMPHRGISFVDEYNVTRYFTLSQSGVDGSLILSEFHTNIR